MNKMESIKLNDSQVKNLIGIGEMHKLNKIYIDTAKKLESLEGISENNQSLTNLGVFNAKNLTNIDAIQNAKNLESVNLFKVGGDGYIKELPDYMDFPKIRLYSVVGAGHFKKVKK
jgi:hypothetical protein